jgi:hypothetical protein
VIRAGLAETAALTLTAASYGSAALDEIVTAISANTPTNQFQPNLLFLFCIKFSGDLPAIAASSASDQPQIFAFAS